MMDPLFERIARLSPDKLDLLSRRLKEKEPASKKRVISRRAGAGASPLSFAQQRIWFLDQLEPGLPVYNVPAAIRLMGRLDVAALEQCLGKLIERHESLRTKFVIVEGQPVQVIALARPVTMPVVDLHLLPESQAAAVAAQLADEEARRPFDLAEGPLLRTTLLRLNNEHHIALVTMHHIISDDWSMGVLIHEVTATYEAISTGVPAQLPDLPIQYADFACWQREWLQGEVLNEQLAYWRRQLGGSPPVLQLPPDCPPMAEPTFRGARHDLFLPGGLTAELKALGLREGVTLFMVVTAAFKTLLYRYTGQEDVLIGVPIANRNHVEIENLIGFFVNTLVLRSDLSGTPTFIELLKRIRETTLGAYAHQDLPFEKIVQELQPDRKLSHTPFFRVLLSLENTPDSTLELLGLTLGLIEKGNDNTIFDLGLSLKETDRGLIGSAVYNVDLFECGTVSQLLRRFKNLLEAIVKEPGQRISWLPLLTEAEREQLLTAWNRTEEVYRPDQCIHELFEKQAERQSFAVAVSCDGQALTYGELNRRANQLAHHLRRLGVGAEVRVAICVDRSIEQIVGLLATLKAGGAYVPIDTSFPTQRITSILDDALPGVIITRRGFANKLEDRGHVVRMEQDWSRIAQESPDNPVKEMSARNAAYLIYTSGSTGQPKGVALEHRGLCNLVAAQIKAFGLDEGKRVLQFANFSFDASVSEIFTTLLAGARLYLGRSESLLSGRELAESLRDEVITTVTLPPTVLTHLPVKELPTLETIVVAGEACPLDLAERAGVGRRFLNAYGPTETTVCATIGEDFDGKRKPHIGRPIANTQVYLLDPHLHPAPVGVAGQLYVGGDGLARCYLRIPGLTAEKFIPNPFGQDPGARLYKTGDLARYLPDGNLEFLGRADDQVKIRGYRIEPGEIVAVLNRHSSVLESVVVARKLGGVGDQLVAYLVVNKQEVSINELRSFLREKLPDYMIPSAFIFLDNLPLTPSGKLDRKALPPPEMARLSPSEDFVSPRTPLEELLAGIWVEVLGIARVGVDDNFFDLGGHSLLATQLVSRVEVACKVKIPLREFFETATIASLAKRIESVRMSGALPQTSPILPVPREKDLPLSFAQERLWFLDQLEPNNPFYILPAAVRIGGRVGRIALERSINEVIRRHETLRANFIAIDGRPIQAIAPSLTISLPIIDLEELSEDERELETARLSAEAASLTFDLAKDPLLRVILLRLNDEDQVLALTMHHIISDGWSISILIDEIQEFYEAFSSDRPAKLAELTIQYADFTLWQRKLFEGEFLETQLSYWKRQLENAPTILELPSDRRRPAIQSFRGATKPIELSQGLSGKLKALCRREGVTLYMALLAVFKVLLFRYTGQRDVVIGTPIANRNHAGIETLIGFFVNTLVLRTNLTGNPSFRELLCRVRETALDAYTYQDLPFERLVEELHPKRDLSRNPLVQINFALQNVPVFGERAPARNIRPVEFETGTTRFDLEVHLWDLADVITGRFEFSTDLFDASTIDRLANHFQVLLDAAIADPEQRLSDLPILTEDERHQLTVEWNSTRTDCPEGEFVHRLFEEQVKRAPGAAALIFEQEELDYEELNARANQLAHYLRKLGVRPEGLVGLYAERSIEMVIGILGILKSGGAYVPLNPEYPRARIALMFEDVHLSVLLIQHRLLEGLPELEGDIVCLDRDWNEIAKESRENLGDSINADNLAYLIFTSGTTGKPKAVMAEHGNLTNVIRASQDQFGFMDSDVVLNNAASSFDISLFEILNPLVAGGTLVVAARDQVLDLDWMVKRMEMSTAIHAVPTLMRQIVNFIRENGYANKGFLHLEKIFVGGELVSYDLLEEMRGIFPAAKIYVLYGPTETTIICTSYQLETGRVGERHLIGKPLRNTVIRLCDEDRNLVPIGVRGEIYVGGSGVTRGYFKRDELTDERYVTIENQRYYRTGDIGRYLPDGNIEFLGRLDQQVKIRGYRVELEEIEIALKRHSAVGEAVVVMREDVPGDKRLVAYIVADAGFETLEEKETGAKWVDEQILQWQAVFDESYGRTSSLDDPSFNITGWDSSYTRQPIPEIEMREWVDYAVKSIFSLQPRRVLEVGCGVGLLLFRIAPRCKEYWGTDFSESGLRYIREQMASLGQELPQVRLLQKLADDFENLEPEYFDTVVLNSVTQYFPKVDYLVRVLEGAVSVTADGGSIFIGDVRSYPLLETFHASVQLFQSPPSTGREQLRRRVQKNVAQDEELTIDPAFFIALKQRHPRISGVRIQLKRGRHHNEITKFRYDVTLRVGRTESLPVAGSSMNWRKERLTLPLVGKMLAESSHELLHITQIPNARLESDVLSMKLLSSEFGPETVDELRGVLQVAEIEHGIDPEDVWALVEGLPYSAEIGWSGSGADGCFDVVFRRRAAASSMTDGRVASEDVARRHPWEHYANNPLQGTFTRKIAPWLRSYLQERLPEYMVPSAFVVLETVPLSPNGKVDIKALPAPDGGRPQIEGAFVAPSNRTEEILAEIWSQALLLDQVGVHDNFFELGGDSILSIQVVAKANQAGLRLSPKHIFQRQTIAELAAIAGQEGIPQAEQGLVLGETPLTPIQHSFFEQEIIERDHFNQSILLETKTPIDAETLERAVERLLVHHDALRLRFVKEESGWRQYNAGVEVGIPFIKIDLTALPEAAHRWAVECAAAEAQKSLDLSTGPVIRIALFDLGAERPGRLLVVAHHLVVDNVSWRILLEDLQTAYSQLSLSESVQFPPKTTSFKDWARRLLEYAQSEAVGKEIIYWLREERQPIARLPVDFYGGVNDENSARTVSEVLAADTTDALLHRVPAVYRTKINDALLTAFVQAFALWVGTPSLLVDLEGHGREDILENVNLSRTVGWFTTVFPVHLRLESAANPGDALKFIKEQFRQIPNRGIGYGLLRYLGADAEIAEKLRKLPWAEVSFNYLGQFDQTLPELSLFGMAEESSGPAHSLRNRRNYLIEVNALVAGGQLRSEWIYSKNLHSRATIEKLARSFTEMLQRLVAHCQSVETGEYTPSDFPLAQLDSHKLSKVLTQINKKSNRF